MRASFKLTLNRDSQQTFFFAFIILTIMSNNRKQPIFARQQWGQSSSLNSSSRDFSYKVDKSWMIPYEHHATNNSRLIFKAGNKDYTLDGSALDAGGRKTVSEIGLKKYQSVSQSVSESYL